MIARMNGMNKLKFEFGMSCGDYKNSLSVEYDFDDDGTFSGGVMHPEDARKLLRLLQKAYNTRSTKARRTIGKKR